MLFGDPVKYFGLVLGVAFTTLLVNQQIGILLGLLDRAGSAVDDVSEADIWVMAQGVRTLDIVLPLRDTELQRVRGVIGVEWAVPLFRGGGIVRTPAGAVESTVIYGVDDVSLIGVPQATVAGRLADLRRPDSVAIDADGYRRVWPGQPYAVGQTFELNDRRAVVVAVVQASPSFASGPVVYTRYSQALQYTNNGRNQLSFILAKAEAGCEPAGVCSEVMARTGLKAMRSSDFKAANVQFVVENTGIPTSFATVVALGVIVGIAVVGLLSNLYVLENLKQFATLKAMGVRNHRIVGMVFAQAAAAGTVGWALGLGAAAAFFQFAGEGDPNFRGFSLPWTVAAASAVLAATIMMFAVAVGLRRVLFVDPAIVFRG